MAVSGIAIVVARTAQLHQQIALSGFRSFGKMSLVTRGTNVPPRSQDGVFWSYGNVRRKILTSWKTD